MPCLCDLKYELKAVPKQKSSIVCLLNWLRTISEQMDKSYVSMQILHKNFFKISHVCLVIIRSHRPHPLRTPHEIQTT